MKHLDLTDNADSIVNFIERSGADGGGDTPECYEYVLNQINTRFSWRTGKLALMFTHTFRGTVRDDDQYLRGQSKPFSQPST